jgi:hypothetical protein
MDKPLYIFDLDSTLRNEDGTLSEPTAEIFRALVGTDRNELWVWTATDERKRSETISWLQKHSLWPARLDMRPEGCLLTYVSLKRQWLLNMGNQTWPRIAAAFDGSKQICKIYRKNGIVSFQQRD